MYINNNSNPTFYRCNISNNGTCDDGGGIYISASSPQIINCTVSNDSAEVCSGIYITNNSAPTIVNTIVSGGKRAGGIQISGSYGTSITYCDFYNNTGGNFVGWTPPGLGVLTGVNANGDSCDVYGNILLNPLFVNQALGNYHLQVNSPCIDAGDPASEPDPDSTLADIGAYYFPQEMSTVILVTLTPHNPPIQIPPGGGSFRFDLNLENTTSGGIDFDFWIEATLPNGNLYQILLRPDLFLPASVNVARPNLSQTVPGSAPAGSYTYTAKAGIHPDSVMGSDSFGFQKLTGSFSGGFSPGWLLSGWDSFEVLAKNPREPALCSVSPNPFNPETEIKFTLPEAGFVNLSIFDIGGRKVVELMRGRLPQGAHSINWNAGDLPSGVYFLNLSFGEQREALKLLLLK